MDTLDMLLGYKPSLREQRDIRKRALAFFKQRLTDDYRPIARQRVRYESEAPDGVYDIYSGEASLTLVTLVGPCGYVKSDQDDEALGGLVGKDAANTRRILKGVTGRIPYFFRLSHRPEERIERAVVLGPGVGSVGFVVGAFGVFFVGRALGWSQSGQKISQ